MNDPGDGKQQDDEFDLDLDLDLEDLDLDEGTEAEPAPDATNLASGEGGPPEDEGGSGEPVELDLDLETDTGDAEASRAATEGALDSASEALTDVAGDGALAVGAAVAAAGVLGSGESSSGSAASTGGAPATVAADAGAAGQVEGQWVWQYAAAPPPPSFSAVFFAGNALKELYRFFACGVLVVVGCLLPWKAGVGELEGTVPGFSLPMGAVSLALALWLVWAACTGIYSRKQKILPVFLMLLPAEIAWARLLEEWGSADASLGFMDQLNETFFSMGSGVFLTLVGSTVVSLQLLLTIIRIVGKKDDKGGRGGKGGASKGKAKKKEKPAKSEKQAKPDKQAKAEKKGKPEKAAKRKDKGGGDDAAADTGKKKSAAGRGRRGRRR